MAIPLSEDIRSILNKLEEYITVVHEEDKEKEGDAAVDSAGDDTETRNSDDSDAPAQDDKVDDMLTQPAGLQKVAGNINVQALINMLGMPEENANAFKSAMAVLRHDDPKLNHDQLLAIAVAFDHMLTLGSSEKSKIASVMQPAKGVSEELDDNKVKAYIAKDQKSPSGPNDSISQMKSMIDAVKNHGTSDEKKELGLN
jgi:hypothetical protein